MNKIKIPLASLTLLVYIAGWIPIARAQDEVDADGDGDGDCVELKEQESAPFDNFFRFSPSAFLNLNLNPNPHPRRLRRRYDTPVPCRVHVCMLNCTRITRSVRPPKLS